MQERDKKDIAEWYQQYGETILKYILMMVRDYQHAEDLTQETFVKAYKNKHSFKGESQPRTWLFSIAHNTTIDFLRKQKPIELIREMLPSLMDKNPLPEEMVEIEESTRDLYIALGNLKPAYREVIILRKIKGFSIEETSQILNWSEGKVKTTLYRAIPALKKQYGKEV
ncbi:RNA polymerase sigma factor [Ornithinibacillus halotolerans]|uniref:RNA polymerase sigma factor n=1 Tax=Ornithinibacillus halotolerans TaxID=1274357 RepID=A0A916W1X1_9BACI|nr:RNA polymerase sigma factor [Ornithinibacillus halotolerans]GGA60542.1 RNA polymerase sigma factor YlaC [Ornithinibacillus halotolerans]